MPPLRKAHLHVFLMQDTEHTTYWFLPWLPCALCFYAIFTWKFLKCRKQEICAETIDL